MEKTIQANGRGPMVLVGCKLPNGLYLDLIDAPAVGGRQYLPKTSSERHVLRGSNSLRVASPFGSLAQGVHQYATTWVPEAFMNEWMRRNADLECVRRGLVFVVQDAKNPKAEVSERNGDKSLRTGLEAMAAEKDPRVATKKPGARDAVSPDFDTMANWEGNAA